MTDIDWTRLVGIGKQDRFDWVRPIEGILEMDLFDLSNVKVIMDEVRRDLNNVDFLGRLEFLALTGMQFRCPDESDVSLLTDEGTRAILDVDGSHQLVDEMLRNNRKNGMSLLSKLVDHGTFSSSFCAADKC